MKNDFNFSPAPDRPLMMMRLRSGHENPEVWDRLFPQLVKSKACCDELWFSTGVGVPPLDVHRRQSALMAQHAEALRREGIIPSLQLQSTLGHSDGIIASVGAEGKTWSSYVGVNGEKCQFISCPRQPGFVEYFREVAKIYAQWHPGSVWIDDDLRLYNHDPAMDPCGCYCPHCLALFGEEEGRSFTREELVALYKEDPGLYKRWENFGIRSLRGVAKAVVESFLEISPETRFGLQHCHKPARLSVIEALHEFSHARVGSRPGGGAYYDWYPHAMLDKGLRISLQIKDQQGYETLSQICPEIESCPRTLCCKTSQGHRIESLYYLALGCDSLSYFIMDPLLETPEWYGKELLTPLAAEAPCYKEFISHNEKTFPGGIGAAPVTAYSPQINSLGLPLMGIPFGAYSKGCSARILWRDAAEKMSVEELEAFFKGNTIVDGHAAMVLQERQLNHLMGNIRVRTFPPSAALKEYYTSDPVNEALETPYHWNLVRNFFAFDAPEDLPVRTPGIYRDCKLEDHGAGTLLFETPEKFRCALLGHEGLLMQYTSSNRVKQLSAIADWVSGGSLPVLTAEPCQMLLVPRITEENILRSVTVINTTIGTQKACKLLLRGVPETVNEAEFIIPSEKRVICPLSREKGFCSVTLPTLEPWAIGWLKIPVK